MKNPLWELNNKQRHANWKIKQLLLSDAEFNALQREAERQLPEFLRARVTPQKMTLFGIEIQRFCDVY